MTGSGKTYTLANVLDGLETTKPVLVLSHNKTLAAQLYGEFKAFFPENAGTDGGSRGEFPAALPIKRSK